jgi:hypothetical protein
LPHDEDEKNLTTCFAAILLGEAVQLLRLDIYRLYIILFHMLGQSCRYTSNTPQKKKNSQTFEKSFHQVATLLITIF